MASEKRSGMPAGIFSATMPPEPEPAEEQGGESPSAEAKASKPRRSRRAASAAKVDESDHGAKLHLSPDVRFRLRMLAYQRGASLSAVANELLDKALPKWSIERAE